MKGAKEVDETAVKVVYNTEGQGRTFIYHRSWRPAVVYIDDARL